MTGEQLSPQFGGLNTEMPAGAVLETRRETSEPPLRRPAPG